MTLVRLEPTARWSRVKSLKSAMWHLPFDDFYTVAYHITYTTNFSNVPLKNWYLTQLHRINLQCFCQNNFWNSPKKNNKSYTVAWQNKAEASHRVVNHLSRSQAEVDTKLIYHVVDVSKNGANFVCLI